MAATAQQAQIVIKRSKKGGHDAHHGGAWKVAYADFVTAMMAFFLLLWLLNATTEAQKQGISDYFSPSTVSTATGGAGGLLSGQTISSPGAMTSRTAQPSLSLSLEPTAGASEGEAELDGGASDAAKTSAKAVGEGDGKGERSGNETTEEKADRAARQKEEMRFDRIEKELREAVDKDPELRALADNLMIDNTLEGLRVQIVDQEGRSMFPSGSANMLERTKKLVAKIAKVIETMPNKIKISGHTDSVPFRSGDKGYGNWELSSDRAQTARRTLIESGLSSERVESVAGRSSKDPLVPEDTTSARNRRISIVLLREIPLPGAKRDLAAAKAAKEAKAVEDAKAAKEAKAAEDAKAAKAVKDARAVEDAKAVRPEKMQLKQDWTGPRVR